MKIGIGEIHGSQSLYVIDADRAYDINELIPSLPVELPQFLERGGLRALMQFIGKNGLRQGSSLSVNSVRWLSPIRSSQKVLAAAVNYRTHGAEAGVSPPSRPFLFVKITSAIVGPYDPISVPTLSRKRITKSSWPL